MDRLPIVLEDDPSATVGQPMLQRLRPGDDLDIPLADRVALLEQQISELTAFLNLQGIETPEIPEESPT